ncbi:MAG: transglutaminase domain-containing protein [Pseudomonadota bacterium]
MKPPALFFGFTLMFWGFQSENTILALVLAPLVEFPRIYRERWEFSPGTFNKISDICVMGIAGAMVVFLAQSPEKALPATLVWLPVLTFPLVAAQEYSAAGTVRLRSLLLFNRKNSRIPDLGIHLGFPYALVCLVAAGAANNRSRFYFAGAALILAWGLFSRCQTPRRTGSFALAMAGACLAGMAVLTSLGAVQGFLTGMTMDLLTGSTADPLRRTTAIGDVGKLKLSNAIAFRMAFPENGFPEPLLFRQASYTYFSNNTWFLAHDHFSPVELASPQSPPARRFTVMGRLPGGKGLLILPENPILLSASGSPVVTKNSVGTVAVDNGPGFITYMAASGQTPFQEEDSRFDAMDLLLPDLEKDYFQTLAGELDPGGAGTEKKRVDLIKNFFTQGFAYSLTLPEYTGKSPILGFMEQSRQGHCEYFASATVLLARAMGLPARYVSGYLVHEVSPLEGRILVREKDAHAWCEVRVNGVWTFLDTTPPDWVLEQQSNALRTLIPDLFSLVMYWINRVRWGDDNTRKQLLWLLVPLALILLRRIMAPGDRLKKARTLNQPLKQDAGPGDVSPNYAMNIFLQILEKKGFPRKPGETLCRFFQRIREQAFNQIDHPALEQAVRLHQSLRFSPEPLPPKDYHRLEDLIRNLKISIRS